MGLSESSKASRFPRLPRCEEAGEALSVPRRRLGRAGRRAACGGCRGMRAEWIGSATRIAATRVAVCTAWALWTACGEGPPSPDTGAQMGNGVRMVVDTAGVSGGVAESDRAGEAMPTPKDGSNRSNGARGGTGETGPSMPDTPMSTGPGSDSSPVAGQGAVGDQGMVGDQGPAEEPEVVCEEASASGRQGGSGAPSGLPLLDVVLAPHRNGEVVDYVDVRLTIEEPNAPANRSLLRLPMVFAGVDSARYDSADISVEDAMGDLPLSHIDDPEDPTNFIYFRRFVPGRATRGDVTVRYRAPTQAFVPVLGSGPPFDLRAEGGGLAGAGVSFLALPDRTTVYRISLHWDLAAMPANSRGVFSRGEGDVELAGPAELLAYSFYLAGPVSSYPDCPGGPFQAFWLSTPPFDVQEVVRWTDQAYRAISTFFRNPDKSYFVFFRHNEGGAIGGAALSDSFMVGYGDAPAPTPERLRHMLAHEIVHNFPAAFGDSASRWYGEGMAEHYSAAITLRAGLISPDEFLAGLNAKALSYYANPLRELPSREVAARFWKDTRVRNIPYDRGALYLASVDAAVRAGSGGMRSLDDLTFAMLDRLQSGRSYDSAAWLALVGSELGPQGRAQYEAMIAGEVLELPSDAYGPCFRSEPTSYPQFELGFDAAVLAEMPRIVTGVVPGSNAEMAGLRTGDEITAPVVLEGVLKDPERPLTLKVRRANADLEIRYVPRGDPVSGQRWTRVAGVPDSDCAL